MVPQVACSSSHHSEIVGTMNMNQVKNTLFSNPANNNCCLPENLLRVCWYKVLLCSAVRFLQFSVVCPILWQNPHTIDVWDEIPEEVFDSLVRDGLILPLPLFPCEEELLPFPFGFTKFP